jgi:hypothetical protein
MIDSKTRMVAIRTLECPGAMTLGLGRVSNVVTPIEEWSAILLAPRLCTLPWTHLRHYRGFLVFPFASRFGDCFACGTFLEIAIIRLLLRRSPKRLPSLGRRGLYCIHWSFCQIPCLIWLLWLRRDPSRNIMNFILKPRSGSPNITSTKKLQHMENSASIATVDGSIRTTCEALKTLILQIARVREIKTHQTCLFNALLLVVIPSRARII